MQEKRVFAAFIVLLSQKWTNFSASVPYALTKAAGYGCFFFIHIARFHNFNDSQHYFNNSNICAFADTFVLEEMKFYFFLFVLTVSASLTHSSYLWKPVSLNRIGWKVPPSTQGMKYAQWAEPIFFCISTSIFCMRVPLGKTKLHDFFLQIIDIIDP